MTFFWKQVSIKQRKSEHLKFTLKFSPNFEKYYHNKFHIPLYLWPKNIYDVLVCIASPLHAAECWRDSFSEETPFFSVKYINKEKDKDTRKEWELEFHKFS